MTRKHKPTQAERLAKLRVVRNVDPIVLEAEQPSVLMDALLATREAEAEDSTDAPIAPPPEAPAPKSVVKVRYKHAYQDRAKAAGLKDKASRRGNGDWLQRELQAETIAKNGTFDLARFEAILDANGVDHSRWNRTTRGWEGRVRMSGSIALRGVVGKSGLLRLPEGMTISLVSLADGGDEAARLFLAKWSN